MAKNVLNNLVLDRYKKAKRDVVTLGSSLLEERQRIQSQISNLQEQLKQINEELKSNQAQWKTHSSATYS